MKQRVYFPENTKSIVVAEGYNNIDTAETAVDAFLQDVTYNEEPESGFHYTRDNRFREQQEKEKYVFTISTY